jgi:hypothetical protein
MWPANLAEDEIMRSLTVAVAYDRRPSFAGLVDSLKKCPAVGRVIVVGREKTAPMPEGCEFVVAENMVGQDGLQRVMDLAVSDYLLFVLDGNVEIEMHSLERMANAAEERKAGLTYSDFYCVDDRQRSRYTLNDYQIGSVRDDFNFGPLMLFSAHALRQAREKHNFIPKTKFAGLYDLRLKVSIDHAVLHVPEPLYCVPGREETFGGQRLFGYVEPGNADVQKEMETVFTDYLKRIDAYVPPSRLRPYRQPEVSFPVEASVVIPVKNREGTVGEAVRSALDQSTDFPFNVIVVDNHSTDGTAQILSELSVVHPRLVHIVPERTDLAIGGCWNLGLDSTACGRYAVQLDSDDLYRDNHVLQRIIDTFRIEGCAMVVGAYTVVDSGLREIPPGLVAHREWTDANGHNNALRVNGLGAPRAFSTALMRTLRFPNVSYGEDYAAALRVCGEYRVSRIYESLYLCRRWSGNTDAKLSLEEANRNDAYKDLVRSNEIERRRKRNKHDR